MGYTGHTVYYMDIDFEYSDYEISRILKALFTLRNLIGNLSRNALAPKSVSYCQISVVRHPAVDEELYVRLSIRNSTLRMPKI